MFCKEQPNMKYKDWNSLKLHNLKLIGNKTAKHMSHVKDDKSCLINDALIFLKENLYLTNILI